MLKSLSKSQSFPRSLQQSTQSRTFAVGKTSHTSILLRYPTLQLQYPAAAAAAAALPQFPAVPQMPQQPVQISLPTIDTSAILNTYTTPSTSSATLTVPSAQGQQQQQLHQQQQQAGHSSGNRDDYLLSQTDLRTINRLQLAP